MSRLKNVMVRNVNLNSLLITVCGVFLKLGLAKLDELNTSSITLKASQEAIIERIGKIERDMVLKTEYQGAIDRLTKRDDALEDRLNRYQDER